jgi:hypothetical protein
VRPNHIRAITARLLRSVCDQYRSAVTEDHVIRNRAAWDRFAEEFVQPGRKAWANDEPAWGTWGVPEAEVGMLSDVEGLVAVELGCGTGYLSAWLARR